MSGEPLVLSEEVRGALVTGEPVVALETSVLAQGLPPPRNLEAAERMSRAVRASGAVPAWILVDGGAVHVGVDDEGRLTALAVGGDVAKVARRDLPMAVAGGRPGATTVSATLWAAHRAGIAVAATGGIGGVHPGTGDVSADLLELARAPGLLVCSGPKSIVDPLATVERLEELGVALVGYGVDRLPFFLVRETSIPLEHRVDTPEAAAAVARASADLGTPSTILLCNPIPLEDSLDATFVAEAALECEKLAARGGVSGKAVTPFLLTCMAERTGGATLEANLALLEANARLAGQIAAALSRG
ncbi:MAG: pseudouridine-5'-phosphate glycosidase [Actinobacteria bacterium]|nr:pseudouridine-5'-phosphate glycosidase [Actinomycetota bacterium]